MSIFSIDPDITKAQTLHSDFYLEDEYFEATKKKIFDQCWHFIGSSEVMKEPGTVLPVTVLEKFMDEPLLLSRLKDGQLKCLSNVCTHRGNILVEKACKLNDIRCRYHGRRFQPDGKFISMPEFKEVQNFPTSADDLKQLPLFQWGNLLFTSLGKLDATLFFQT